MVADNNKVTHVVYDINNTYNLIAKYKNNEIDDEHMDLYQKLKAKKSVFMIGKRDDVEYSRIMLDFNPIHKFYSLDGSRTNIRDKSFEEYLIKHYGDNVGSLVIVEESEASLVSDFQYLESDDIISVDTIYMIDYNVDNKALIIKYGYNKDDNEYVNVNMIQNSNKITHIIYNIFFSLRLIVKIEEDSQDTEDEDDFEEFEEYQRDNLLFFKSKNPIFMAANSNKKRKELQKLVWFAPPHRFCNLDGSQTTKIDNTFEDFLINENKSYKGSIIVEESVASLINVLHNLRFCGLCGVEKVRVADYDVGKSVIIIDFDCENG